MWRQGDVLIERVDAIPPTAEPLKRPILAAGAATGRRHQIKDRKAARLFRAVGPRGLDLFLDVLADSAEVVHPEHGTITLPRGRYRVWPQREFGDFGTRPVLD